MTIEMNRRQILSLALWFLLSSCAASAQTLFPANSARDVNPDVQLKLTFTQPPLVGKSGKVWLYDATNDRVVDRVSSSPECISSRSECISSRSEYISSRSEYISSLSECISSRSKYISSHSEYISSRSECISSRSECSSGRFWRISNRSN